MDDVRMMRREQRRMRIVIEGIGTVDVDRGLRTKDGEPRVRVDVISDFDHYGPAPDGLRYQVENGDPGPGVVFMTGRKVSRETTTDADGGDQLGRLAQRWAEAVDREVSRETYPDVCDDGCGKHVGHKVNGDLECGPR